MDIEQTRFQKRKEDKHKFGNKNPAPKSPKFVFGSGKKRSDPETASRKKEFAYQQNKNKNIAQPGEAVFDVQHFGDHFSG